MKKFLIILFVFYSICVACRGQNQQSVEAIKNNIESQYIAFCTQLNKQLPIRVDDVTLLKAVAFINWTMTCHYSIEIDADNYEASELKDFLNTIRIGQKEQIPRMIANGNYQFTQPELYEYLKLTGLKFRFVYRDINNKQIGAYNFNYNDFQSK